MILDGLFDMINLVKNWLKKHLVKKAAKSYKAKDVYLSPKDAATAKGEPWVAVLDTHVDINNPRNGFFELDWNEHFILMLRQNGYVGGSDEAIVDLWFQDLCREIGNEEGVPMDRRYSGYINVNKIGNGKSEMS